MPGTREVRSSRKELTDLIQRANAEAVATLTHRFTETVDEVRALTSKVDPSKVDHGVATGGRTARNHR